ncbi:hypothetical protein GJAV_G00009450 [Gymnothorax javanicus]|nr:hypothetical protein GJAV_G00009450 [Gymnothorax javanicus]
MSSMMEKLRLLEKTVHSQRLEIHSWVNEKKVTVLQEKLRILQKSKEEPVGCDRVQELEETCQRLQEQVWEMERFLNDYGMMWVGSSGIPQEEAETKEELPHGPHLLQPDSVKAGRDFQMNFDLVLQSVRELNLLAGEGVSHVQPTPGGARLGQQSPIPLSIYHNGIVLFQGPFRPYSEASTQQCMQDLMDGYFPSELQERFPDGVPFQVTDRREEEYKERPVGAEFPGEGKAVGEGTQQSNYSKGHTPKNYEHTSGLANGHSYKNNAPIPKNAGDMTHPVTGAKLSMEQFLNKLPKVVIKSGKVIDIRSSLMADMQSPPCTSAVINTPALQNHRLPADDVIELKVRAEDGRESFTLRMLLSETIGQLRQYLDTHRGSRTVEYDIISAFPKRRYGDNSQTLRSCGLTSNCTLLLRPHRLTPDP